MCENLFIGMSTRSARLCFVEHCSEIRQRVREAPLVSHFIDAGHSDTDPKAKFGSFHLNLYCKPQVSTLDWKLKHKQELTGLDN